MSDQVDPPGGEKKLEGMNPEPAASYGIASRLICARCGIAPMIIRAEGRDPVMLDVTCHGSKESPRDRVQGFEFQSILFRGRHLTDGKIQKAIDDPGSSDHSQRGTDDLGQQRRNSHRDRGDQREVCAISLPSGQGNYNQAGRDTQGRGNVKIEKNRETAFESNSITTKRAVFRFGKCSLSLRRKLSERRWRRFTVIKPKRPTICSSIGPRSLRKPKNMASQPEHVMLQSKTVLLRNNGWVVKAPLFKEERRRLSFYGCATGTSTIINSGKFI